MRRLLLSLCLLIAVCGRAQTNLYVDSSISGSGSGGSWAIAYKTLNEALNTANAASTGKYIIHVAKGTYYPSGLQSGTNRDSTFFIARSGIRIYGGYQTGGGLRTLNAYPTILSGNIGAASANTDNSRHVIVIAGIFATSDTIMMDGLRIVEGHASTGGPASIYNGISVRPADGSGMVIKNVACKVVLNDCLFWDNTSGNYAGAVYNETSATTFNHCGFSGNIAAGAGGALYINSDSNTASVVIANCGFYRNAATGMSGGCIYNTRNGGPGPGTIITNCQFGDGWSINSANLAGGAIADISTNCAASIISGCSFNKNSALYGGAIFCNGTNVPISATPYIKGCYFLSNIASTFGGGVAISASGFNYIIDSTSFLNNHASGLGGGLYSALTGVTYGSIGLVSHCRFDQDSASLGGGVYSIGSTNFRNNRFTHNMAVMGAGIYNRFPTTPILVEANSFKGNLASQSGGGIFNRSHYADTISNCQFTGNKAGLNGGGLADSACSPIITNCTFAGDTALSGNGIWNYFSSPVIRNSIIWEGNNGIANVNSSVPVITYSTIYGGHPGTGNLSSDPHFMAPAARSAAPTEAGDYTLMPCGPAVDGGSNSGSYTSVKDVNGNPRLYGVKVDQGAYEYPGTPFPLPIAGLSSTCAGGNILLGNPATGGTWSSSNAAIASVNATGVVTTYSVGVDTITYALSVGSCSTSVTKVIIVKPSPLTGPITGPDTICSGSKANFNIAIDSSSPIAINWTSANNSIAYQTGFGNTFQGWQPGTTSIRCTVTSISGCSEFATKNLTVLPTPVPGQIMGNSHYCLHDTATLTDTTAGGTWSSSDTYKIKIDAGTGFFTALDTGIVTLHYTVTNDVGCSGVASKTINVETVNASVTQNGMVLNADDSGALYHWLNCDLGYRSIPGENRQSFTPSRNGRYALRIIRGSCMAISACHNITGLDVPAAKGADAIQIYPNPTSGILSIITAKTLPEYIILQDVTGRILQHFLPSGNHTLIDLAQYVPGHYMIEVGSAGQRYRHMVTVIR